MHERNSPSQGQRSLGDGRSCRERKLTLMLEEPDEHRGGRHRIVIGSAAVKNALLLLDSQLARLEAHKELLIGEPRGEHPIRPGREGAQQVVNRSWPIQAFSLSWLKEA
jgi:hypothetical protein